MAASIRSHRFPAALLGGLAAFALLSSGCALKESTDPDGKTSIVISVNDTAKVNLDFTDITKTVFTDSGEFDLDGIRSKMKKEGLDPAAVEITGIDVTYDDQTKTFLSANKGIPFFIKIYVREDGGARKLALETMLMDQGSLKVLTFNPDQTLFELNKQLFPVEEGFPGILIGIKDESKHKLMCIAELTVNSPLKAAGKLNLNMVVTVAGK